MSRQVSTDALDPGKLRANDNAASSAMLAKTAIIQLLSGFLFPTPVLFGPVGPRFTSLRMSGNSFTEINDVSLSTLFCNNFKCCCNCHHGPGSETHVPLDNSPSEINFSDSNSNFKSYSLKRT